MSKRQALLDAIFNREDSVQVYQAEVISVEGDTCTVKLIPSGLEVDEVKLHADPGNANKVVLYPKKGSTVLVGCIENIVANLYIAQVSEITGFDLLIGKTALAGDENNMLMQTEKGSVFMQPEKLTITQGQTNVELSGGKVSIKNDQTSLKGLFDDLSTLIQNLKVVTAQGPSTALFPDTLAALTQFKTKYPLLLS